jgi:LPPG:FO 2-phospho-L-lactate transferase
MIEPCFRFSGKGRVVALCGGVGGAKLAAGLARVLGEERVVIVNTADDFEHLGLAISPDIDTVLYTLGGRADKERGWGRADESWSFLRVLGELGGETWFRLGDQDLALHVLRTQGLRAGRKLTAIVGEVARRFDIRSTILPMSDDPIRTIVETREGDLAFQRYFVERRCAPQVLGIRFDGASGAGASAQVREALAAPSLRAIVVCPSNPYLSVDPILATPNIRKLIEAAQAPVVAVSPIIGGAAVKGPTTKIMRELGVPATSQAIVQHYRGLIDGLIIDETDAAERGLAEIAVKVTRTLMQNDADRDRLAVEALAFADELANKAMVLS